MQALFPPCCDTGYQGDAAGYTTALTQKPCACTVVVGRRAEHHSRPSPPTAHPDTETKGSQERRGEEEENRGERLESLPTKIHYS